MMYRRRNNKPEIETHKIKEFQKLLVKYGQGVGIDPFARNCTHAYYTNDINPDTLAKYNLDALDFLEQPPYLFNNQKFDFVIFDPPFSDRMSKDKYGTSNLYSAESNKASRCQKIAARMLKQGGYFIKAGYNSNPPSNNFELRELCLLACGGNRNDIIFSVWEKTFDLDEWVVE
ncbi:MAG: hypothetical protein L7R67_03380 [Nitrosopumilus sp.]|nr:hypothetical protein [Nitrosopumilus sp.]